MSHLPLVRVQARTAIVLSAFALYVVVFLGRLASDDPANALAFLYVLPIVLVAIELGLGAALVAVAIALGLVSVWDGLTDANITALGYAVRGLVFVAVGTLCAQMAERVRRTTEASDRTFELSGDLLCTADLNGYFTRLNGRWTETLGWSAEELMARPFTDFVHPDDRERTHQESGHIADRGEPTVSFTNRLATKDGGWRQVEWSSKLDTAKGVIYAAARDVTDRHEAEQRRLEAEQRFRVTFEDSSAGMALVGLAGADTGRILETNGELAEILGVPRDELIGAFSLSEFAHPDDLPVLIAGMKSLADGDARVLHTEVRIVRPDGGVRWVDLTTSIVRAADGAPRYRLSQLYDIDVRKLGEERLRHLADHDAMSGLHNRRRWVLELEEELANQAQRGSRGAVLAIDLDHFKEVNDSAGHAIGDAVIAAVGRALTGRLRSGDVAGRLGGDEFAVLVRRVDGEQAVLVAHGLLAALESELAQIDSGAARAVTMSVGVALIDDEAPSGADPLLARADAAMYESKRRGGSRVELAISQAQEGRASFAPPERLRHAVPRLR